MLTDLSAAGLIDPFLWLTDPVDTALPPVLTVIDRGGTLERTVQQFIAGQSIDLINYCVVVPLIAGERVLSGHTERRVADLFESTFGGAPTLRARALIARPGVTPPPDAQIAVDGWHNLLIAPEDGRGPGVGLGRFTLPASGSAADIGRYAAPVIAGALGLWRGLDFVPVGEEWVPPGNVVRLVRSYYRRLETVAAEADLRRQLLSHDGRMPLPSSQQGQIVYADNDARAAGEMADRFWRKNSRHLVGSRTEYPAPEAKEEVGAWQAIKLFLSFMWAALLNAPAVWWRGVVDRFSEGVASTINRTVFGNDDSAYEVVFNGRTAKGKPAGWADIARASSQLNDTLAAGTGVTVPKGGRADLAELWQDYSQAALTLADAGPRSDQLPPAQSGFDRAVLREAGNVVPGPAARFADIPGVVAAAIDIPGVDATDKLGIDFLKYNLQEFERTRPDQGADARTTITKLDEWQQRHADGFGVLLGRKIAETFNGVYAEVLDLLRKLQVPLEPPPEMDSANKKLARWIQIGFIFSLLVTAAVVYVNRLGRLSWWLATTIAVGVFLFSILLIGWKYYMTQKELLHLLHRRKATIAVRTVHHKRLLEALRDLERLAQAYSEYLSWSRAIGSFLSAPLGPNNQGDAALLRVSWGLPLSTGIAYAAPADADIAATVGRLRHDLFRTSWLSPLWEELVHRAFPPNAGTVNVDLNRSPLWSEPGAGSGSTLDRWSTDLFDGKLTSTGAERTWQQARALLGGPAAGGPGMLVSQVQDSSGAATTTQEFLAQLDEANPPTDMGLFGTALLDATAVVNGATKVVSDRRRVNHAGVGITCAVTQFSDPIAVHNLRFDGDLEMDTSDSTSIEAPMESPFGTSAPQAGHSAQDDELRPPEIGGGFRI